MVGFAATYVIQPGPSDGKDTSVGRGGSGTEFRANQNDGASAFISLGMIGNGGQYQRGLIQFDLSGLGSGQVVNSARLGLTIGAIDFGATSNIELYRMKQGWVEGTGGAVPTSDGATWQTYDGVNAWPGISGFRSFDGGGYSLSTAEINDPIGMGILGGSFVGQVSWFELNPTKIQEWLDGSFANNGLLIRSLSETSGVSSEYPASSEHTNAAWRPILEITAVPEPGTMPFLCLGLVTFFANLRRRLRVGP